MSVCYFFTAKHFYFAHSKLIFQIEQKMSQLSQHLNNNNEPEHESRGLDNGVNDHVSNKTLFPFLSQT